MSFVEKITAEETYPLRQKILRPHQPAGQCRFAADLDDCSAHFGVMHGGAIVGIVSVFRETNDRLGMEDSWRLRAMATDVGHRNRGLGLALLEAAESYVSAQGGKCTWANARLQALGFYEKAGYTALGERFELAHVGPHILVVKMLR